MGKKYIGPITRYNGKYVLKKTTPQGESETVPGESYSIKELLDRFTRGTMPAIGKEGIYDDPKDFTDGFDTTSSNVDLTDLDIIKREKAYLDKNAETPESKDAPVVEEAVVVVTDEPESSAKASSKGDKVN